MPIAPERKQQVVKEYGTHEGDTGSPEVQVALLTEQITDLSKHLGEHKQDHASRRGLLMAVSRRNRLLRHLASNDRERYQSLIRRLGLRK